MIYSYYRRLINATTDTAYLINVFECEKQLRLFGAPVEIHSRIMCDHSRIKVRIAER